MMQIIIMAAPPFCTNVATDEKYTSNSRIKKSHFKLDIETHWQCYINYKSKQKSQDKYNYR
jgi:hypothetical protein